MEQGRERERGKRGGGSAGSWSGLNCVFPQIYVQALNPGTCACDLIGHSIFVDLIKDLEMRSF